MNVFDILGPVMIGPSSSHTAGAARIGQIARIMLGEPVVKADIYLHGSFAQTYRGHGTDRAIVGGLLGFSPGDERIRQALVIAGKEGLEVNLYKSGLGDVHPNTAKLAVSGPTGKTLSLMASSIGGGNIKVINLAGFAVDFNGQFHTLVIPHMDRPGAVGAVTKLLADKGINIAQMKVTREHRGSQAMMIIETDEAVDQSVVDQLKNIPNLVSVTLVEPV